MNFDEPPSKLQRIPLICRRGARLGTIRSADDMAADRRDTKFGLQILE